MVHSVIFSNANRLEWLIVNGQWWLIQTESANINTMFLAYGVALIHRLTQISCNAGWLLASDRLPKATRPSKLPADLAFGSVLSQLEQLKE